MNPMSIYDLPLETVSLIIQHAQLNDQQALLQRHGHQIARPQLIVKDGKQQQQQYSACTRIAASSALQLSRTCRAFHEASLPVLYQTIDFTRVHTARRPLLYRQLCHNPDDSQLRSYSRYLRSLKLKIALGTTISTTTTTPAPHPVLSRVSLLAEQSKQALLEYNDALSIPQATALLDALPHLTSLEVILVNALPGSYFSRLPVSLTKSLRRLAPHLHSFGISSEQLRIPPSSPSEAATNEEEEGIEQEEEEGRIITATPFFQLDEQLVADAISTLPFLHTLSIGEVSYDTLASGSPLFEAVSNLRNLKRLYLLDESLINEHWTNRPLIGPLESLHLTFTSKSVAAIPSLCHDTFINLHKNTLKHLTLVDTSSSPEDASLTTHSTASVGGGRRRLYQSYQYNLPVLESLSIQTASRHSELGTLSYLSRYSSCAQLEKLSLKLVEGGMSVHDLGMILMQGRFKALRCLEVEFVGESDITKHAITGLREVGRAIGVDVSRV